MELQILNPTRWDFNVLVHISNFPLYINLNYKIFTKQKNLVPFIPILIFSTLFLASQVQRKLKVNTHAKSTR